MALAEVVVEAEVEVEEIIEAVITIEIISRAAIKEKDVVNGSLTVDRITIEVEEIMEILHLMEGHLMVDHHRIGLQCAEVTFRLILLHFTFQEAVKDTETVDGIEIVVQEVDVVRVEAGVVHLLEEEIETGVRVQVKTVENVEIYKRAVGNALDVVTLVNVVKTVKGENVLVSVAPEIGK